MKKMIPMLGLLFILFLAAGCREETADYTGSYALLRNEGSTSLVVVWEYPADDIEVDMNSMELDLSNLEPYIDENEPSDGNGPSLNNLLGSLGFNRKFLNIQPIKISEANIKKITGKNVKIRLTLKDANKEDTVYTVVLKYNTSIRADGTAE